MCTPTYLGDLHTTLLCRQRNLNIYGFTRLTKGQYASGYFHKMFERDIGDKELDEVIRVSNKGKQSEPSPHSGKPSPVNTDWILRMM